MFTERFKNLIVLAMLAILTIIAISDKDTDHIQNLHKTIDEDFKELQKNNQVAIDSVFSLQNILAKYKIENEILRNQNDSILLQNQRKIAADWNELTEIKEKYKEVNQRLNYLRKINKKYQ